MQTAWGQLMDHWPWPTERGRGKETPPVNQHSENPTPKQDGWWATELISGTWGQATPHWGRSWLSSRHWKTGEKMVRLPNHLVKLRQSLCLNTNTRAGCCRSNTRTTKNEILLFLNLEFFLCICLFVFFLICLFVFVCSSLPVDFIGVILFCFVSFTIVS
jgi:hypothetical protein